MVLIQDRSEGSVQAGRVPLGPALSFLSNRALTRGKSVCNCPEIRKHHLGHMGKHSDVTFIQPAELNPLVVNLPALTWERRWVTAWQILPLVLLSLILLAERLLIGVNRE